ncbi:hypothetical protein F66182_4320 [Fusarium sp. NRRL 66182]|nr:hypothetical protein F66182_4320 [Fusarium sp. NRRL 66182]
MAQQDHIYSPIPSATLLNLASVFWAPESTGNYPARNLQPYSEYYSEQCRTLYHTHGVGFPCARHADVIELGRKICQGSTREQVVQDLQARDRRAIERSDGQPDHVDAIHGAVDLVARLILMADVGKPARNRMWTGRSYRSWHGGTIHDFAADAFPVQRSNQHDGIQLDRDFNARNLDIIGGLKVEPTNNLLDHLQVVEIEGQTTVMIFHHACFLHNQENQIFPQGFVEETLQTLALLFPQNKWYRASKAWYHKYFEPAMADADLDVLACGPLTMTNIDDYRYWHDRLVRLKQVFDQARPGNLGQWWNDRREGTQWYALWVAVGFTVFFGLIQSIQGAMQVYIAYHPPPG